MKFIIFLWSIFFSSILYAIPMNDKSGLSLTEVDQIIKISENSSIEVLQKVIREARKNNQKVTVYGSQHTQGGHIFYNQGIVLNLSNLTPTVFKELS
jgi:decaprenylphospho-beta-D-ribofuranose 2-oxidase